jgi:DNA-binding transcriptional LysR family regulator
LRPAAKLDVSKLQRRFILRTSEGFAETFGPRFLSRLRGEAPGVTLQFVGKPDKESAPLREGEVDLETGVIDVTTAPEMRATPLFEDRWIGVVRKDHPLVRGKMTAKRYAGTGHVHVLRRGLHSDVDDAVNEAGLDRHIAIIVQGFSAAIALARETDLVATVPERHTAGLRQEMHAFSLPFAMAPFTISMLWHPRMDGDLAHRWLRGLVRGVCSAKDPR